MTKPKFFIVDVDGVMTTGQFLYTAEGKTHKIFGPHDHDGLKLLKNLLKIEFITADINGFEISKRRIVHDLGFELNLVTEDKRLEHIKKNYDINKLVYMGDGLHDVQIIKECMYGIAPINSRFEAKNCADYITPSKSGEGAVLDACIKIKEIFFN